MSESSVRVSKLLIAARQNPEFALRLLATLPPPARAEALRRWCLPGAPEAAPVSGPSIRKCSAEAPASKGLSAQLSLFARSVGRVG